MDKQTLVTNYATSTAKVNKILKAIGLDHNASDFSPEQIALFDQVWTLMAQDKLSCKDALELLGYQPSQSFSQSSSSTVLDPKLTNLLQERSTIFAEHILDESPDILKEQRAAARKIIVDSFWNRINEIGRSPEFQRKFDAALYGEEILDVSVLPGESSVLPESSSSDS
jgi:hypothetical protein